MADKPNDNLSIIRWPLVSELTGFRSKSHVEQLEKKGQFPRSVKIGVRAKGWILSEVNSWIEERIESSRGRDGKAA